MNKKTFFISMFLTMILLLTYTAIVSAAPPLCNANGPYTVQCPGSSVTLDGTGSSDPDGDALVYQWDFGDGSPVGFGATISHVYQGAAGTSWIGVLTVTDVSGLIDTCNFIVSSIDTTPPQITCPADMTVGTTSCGTGGVVTYTAYTSDACGLSNFECTPPSGAIFPAGTTTVTCASTDTAGNTAACAFHVTVNPDNIPPLITCPADITVNSCRTEELINYPDPDAEDNCSIQSLVCTPPSGSTFPGGTTTVTCTATDPPGNTASCAFHVTVNPDNIPPLITCPADITIISCTDAEEVNYTPDATDNCDIQSLVCTPSSGSTFPVGVTNVTCTATDPPGNSATCVFDLEVICPTCRTAGFWGTHAGTECPKNKSNCGSQDITRMVIDACGECIDVCGEVVQNTEFDVDDADSAVEAMCVPVHGDIRLQLARQLTAASLNCCISGVGSDCAGSPAWEYIFSGCNTACENQSTEGYQPCIDALDCLNKGGNLVALEPVICEPPLEDSCAFQPLCNETLDLCFDGKKEKMAGSANACNRAIKSACGIIPPGESECTYGTKDEDPEDCCGNNICGPGEDGFSCPQDCDT